MNKQLQIYIDDTLKIIKFSQLNKNVYYTALFKKNYDIDEPAIFQKKKNFYYIIFKNIDNLNTSWNIVKVNLFNNNPILTNRIFKWLSHIFLKDYEICIYMDSYISPKIESEINFLINNIYHKKHTKRNCVYNEVNACFKSKKINLDQKNYIIKYYKKNKIQTNLGLYHNDIFIKNNTSIVQNYHNELINLMLETGCFRDQLFLSIIYSKKNFY